MISVYILCEGRTESAFVQNVLAPDLGQQNIFVYPFQIGRRRKGGNVSIDRLLPNIRAQLHSRRNAYCTSLIDYYGLDEDFPGKSNARNKSTLGQKQVAVCDALSNELAKKLDEGPMGRFIPYVQMHEFEGLLFSDTARLATEVGRPDLEQQFADIRKEFKTPEHIDDSPLTAPSKRIQKLVPRYRKVQMGERAARAITLAKIRQECPLFDAWLTQLENLPPLSA